MLAKLLEALVPEQKIQITLWEPGDSSVEHTFPSYIQHVDGTFFLVAPPSKDMEKANALIEPGILVGVMIDCNPTPFIFYPTVQSIHAGAEPGYWLTIQPGCRIEAIQRRRHVRVSMTVSFDLEYRFGAIWKPMEARTEDMSAGGMRFNSAKQFAKNQELRIHIKLGRETPMLHLPAKVVFSKENRVRKQPGDLYTTACQFGEIEDSQETVIVRECFRRELGLER